MSTIGMMLLEDSWDSPLSAHFGMAKWVLICDTATQQKQFQRNGGLSGSDVVHTLVAHGCQDAIFVSIGAGGLHHLHAAQIRGWYGPDHLPAHDVFEQWKAGRLRRARHARSDGHGPGQRQPLGRRRAS